MDVMERIIFSFVAFKCLLFGKRLNYVLEGTNKEDFSKHLPKKKKDIDNTILKL